MSEYYIISDEFRDFINHKINIDKYTNVGGNNHWNIICSAMDWLDVATYNLDNNTLNKIGLNESGYYHFIISMIDLAVESVRQLYRVFSKTDCNPIIDIGIFEKSNTITNEDDYSFFKTIRACFASHPVNLKLKTELSRSEKFYASWSMISHSSVLRVLLYPINSIETGFITFDLHTGELFDFLKYMLSFLNAIKRMVE